MTIEGTGFDSNARDEVYWAGLRHAPRHLVGNGEILSRNSTRIVVRQRMEGAAIGTYQVQVVNGNGNRSEPVQFELWAPLRLNRVTPTVVVPSTFDMTLEGTGFDPVAIDQVYVGNRFIGNGRILSRSSIRIVVRQFMDRADPIKYQVKVKNENGAESNALEFELRR